MMHTSETSAAEDFIKGLWRENPVFVQVLGMCPVLAVSNSAINALTMGIATAFVLMMSNLLVSTLRNFIPRQVRIATYILLIASFVTLVDFVIQAISLEVHKSLGPFVSLIVVNCLILGRAEAFASRNTVRRSLLDALGMGTGFTFALLVMGSIRELLGAGTIFAVPIMPANFQPWVVMVLPGGGFFTLGMLLLILNGFKQRSVRQAQAAMNVERGVS